MKNLIIISSVLIILTTIIVSMLYYSTTEYFGSYKLENQDDIMIHNKIAEDDTYYFTKFFYDGHIFSSLRENNKLKTPISKKNKLLFVTFENRQKEYIDIHNENISNYTKKWGYSYKFIKECSSNVYWCKIEIVLNELLNGDYDYVIWLDSDTAIKNNQIDIGSILNQYHSDIFVGSDNNKQFNLINAGVFIIKNTDIGKQFLSDCLNGVNKICFNKDKSLKGIWAASCYEQGQMNLLIANKYLKNTTILPNKYILNSATCNDNVFIMHLYRGSDNARKKCLLT